jgi:hypothetical protein
MQGCVPQVDGSSLWWEGMRLLRQVGWTGLLKLDGCLCHCWCGVRSAYERCHGQ